MPAYTGPVEEKKVDGETTQFIKQMDRELLGWEEPEARLREALDRGDFRLHAQPVLRSDSGAIAFTEVLVRMREEESAVLAPGEFLPAFEHYGMAAELDRWVLSHAIERMAGAGSPAQVSVNISTPTLEDGAFAGFAAGELHRAGVEPGRLIVEIDESDVIEHRDSAALFAGALKAAGCRILIDGFARRSVSFEPLKSLKADYVKVDGSLVRNFMRFASATSKVKTILKVGETTGVGVIAECVEDEKVLNGLKLLKVPYVQGFAVRPPVPIEQLFS